MFVLTILEKIKEARLKFSHRSVTNHEEPRVKLTRAKLNKLKSAAKNKIGITLKIPKKNFQDKELLNEFFAHEEPRVKLTRAKLNKLKSTAKNKIGITLKIPKKNFQDKELLNEFFLTARQKNKIRNVFTNNMPTDIKLSKGQLSKII